MHGRQQEYIQQLCYALMTPLTTAAEREFVGVVLEFFEQQHARLSPPAACQKAIG